MPPTGDLTHNPGMCPDWGLNQQPFGLQAGAQSTEPHQPGQYTDIFIYKYLALQVEPLEAHFQVSNTKLRKQIPMYTTEIMFSVLSKY